MAKTFVESEIRSIFAEDKSPEEFFLCILEHYEQKLDFCKLSLFVQQDVIFQCPAAWRLKMVDRKFVVSRSLSRCGRGDPKRDKVQLHAHAQIQNTLQINSKYFCFRKQLFNFNLRKQSLVSQTDT